MPDRKGLVSGGKDMTLKYWDISSLYPTPSRGNSETTKHLGHLEEQTPPEREFSGHKPEVH